MWDLYDIALKTVNHKSLISDTIDIKDMVRLYWYESKCKPTCVYNSLAKHSGSSQKVDHLCILSVSSCNLSCTFLLCLDNFKSSAETNIWVLNIITNIVNAN